MPVSYPKDNDGKLEWWRRRLQHATDYYRPFFEASQILLDQYNMQAATERERDMEDMALSSDPATRIKTNIIYGWIDQSVSNIAAHDPKFNVTPFNKEGIGQERFVAKISDYWYRETGQLAQDKRTLLDAFLCPWGVSKLGYTIDFEEMTITNPLINPGKVIDDPVAESMFLSSGELTTVDTMQNHEEHIGIHLQAIQQPDTTPQGQEFLEAHIQDHQRLLDKDNAGNHSSIKWEAPYGRRWSPGDFLIDPFATDGIHDARWIAFRYVRHIDEMMVDDSLENTSGLEPNDELRMGNAPEASNIYEVDDFGMVEGYEVYANNMVIGQSQRSNLFINFSPQHNKFFRYSEEWPFRHIDGFPVEMLNFNNSVTTWFNKPPLLLAGGDALQSLVNEILDSYLSVIRKQKNLFLYDPRYVSDTEINDILQADDMEAFEVEGLVESQGRAVQPVQFGDVQNDKGALLNMVQTMFDRSAGTPQPVALPQSDSATEANIMDKRNSAREDERAQAFKQFQIRKATKFWQLTTEFKPDRVFLIDPNAREFISITEDMAKGEYDFEIDITSGSKAVALERKQYLDLINLMGGLTEKIQQIYGEPPNIGELIKLLLVRGYEIHDPERILPFLDKPVGEVINPAAPQGGPPQNGAPKAPAKGPGQAPGGQRGGARKPSGAVNPSMMAQPPQTPSAILGNAQRTQGQGAPAPPRPRVEGQ